MLKNILTISALLICFICLAQTPPKFIFSTTKNGNEKINLTYRDQKYLLDGSLYNGTVFQIHPERQIVTSKLSIKDGLLDGIQFRYFEDGKVYSKINYKNGELEGSAIEFDENGNIEEEIIYNGKDFVKNKYFPDGKLRRKITSKNGIENGIEYNEAGQKIMESVRSKGETISEKFYETSTGPALTGFTGYWKAETKTFATAIHIIKDKNLYTVKIFKDKSMSIKIEQNLVLSSSGRLNTQHGTFQYIEGNDVILDQSLTTAVKFTRIPKAQWNAMTGIR